jgi:hypothetical protein
MSPPVVNIDIKESLKTPTEKNHHEHMRNFIDDSLSSPALTPKDSQTVLKDLKTFTRQKMHQYA